uniref:Putative MAT1-2-12 protein n=1 Tax=Teratosphaeria gauchensis TaxID=405846 RepID=A0A5C0PZ13_9PEZI|nr:putative MAT1-2-12 protein [Teratosphaeria gauchensis]
MPRQLIRKPALRRRLAAQNEDQAREKISRMIEPFIEILEAEDLLGEPPSEEWKEVLKPALFARRAVLPIGQPLNPKAVLSLNKLYVQEHKLLRDAQDDALSRIFEEEEDEDELNLGSARTRSGAQDDEDVTGGKQLALFKYAQDKIRDKIDRVTFGRGQTQRFSTSQTPHTFPVFAECLLADFFSVCPNPNLAELLMLTEACEAADVDAVQYWFESRKRQLACQQSAEDTVQIARESTRITLGKLPDGTWRIRIKACMAAGMLPFVS